MTLFEKISLNARQMKYSIVKTDDDRYIIVSPFRDDDGNFRETLWKEDIEGAEKLIGMEVGVSERTWDLRKSDGCRYVGVWHPPQPEGYKEGDLVDLPDTEEARALGDAYLFHEALGNRRMKITKCEDGNCLVKDVWVPSHLLIPHIPTDEETKGQDTKQDTEQDTEQEEPITREEVREIVREELLNRGMSG